MLPSLPPQTFSWVSVNITVTWREMSEIITEKTGAAQGSKTPEMPSGDLHLTLGLYTFTKGQGHVAGVQAPLHQSVGH